MNVVSLIVCGMLALPALAQESKSSPKPQEGAKAEKRAEREVARRAAVREHQALSDYVQFQLQRARHGEEIDLRGWHAVAAQLPKDRHVTKVPAADQALLDIQKAAQEARSAEDLDATLKALDEVEKAVMRARAALRKAEDKPEKKGK